MVLHYLTKKENKEKSQAKSIYNEILKRSAEFINFKHLYVTKDYNTSFELISILLVIYINLILEKNYKNSKLINEYLIKYFISDLDESLRVKGIGDMSIGKYVKSYVKKFYFRLSKLKNINDFETEEFNTYLSNLNFINKEKIEIFSKILEEYKVSLYGTFNIKKY